MSAWYQYHAIWTFMERSQMCQDWKNLEQDGGSWYQINVTWSLIPSRRTYVSSSELPNMQRHGNIITKFPGMFKPPGTLHLIKMTPNYFLSQMRMMMIIWHCLRGRTQCVKWHQNRQKIQTPLPHRHHLHWLQICQPKCQNHQKFAETPALLIDWITGY